MTASERYVERGSFFSEGRYLYYWRLLKEGKGNITFYCDFQQDKVKSLKKKILREINRIV